MSEGLHIAIINQEQGGGATAAAREALVWGPGQGLRMSYHPTGNASWPSLLAALQESPVDLLHLHCWYGSYDFDLPLQLQASLPDVPLVITLHDVAVINQYGPECWECYRNAWCLGCPALSAWRRWRPNYRVLARQKKRRLPRHLRAQLVLPSRWMQRRLRRSAWSRLPAEIIPYGIDTQRFAPGPKDRARFGLPEGPCALFVGNMYSAADHRKGVPDLMSAWPAVHAALPAANLVLAGQVELGELGALPPCVRALGHLDPDALPDLLRSVDLLVLPTRGDNLPLAVLEAQSSALPVVATQVGGLPEQVEQNRTGLLVPAQDPAALSLALRDLLQDPKRARELGAAGRKRTLARFAREMCAARHVELYQRLVR